MKLLLMSDTHGECARAKQALEDHPDMDAYVHLGDVGFDAKWLKGMPIVCGNHDQRAFPMEKVMMLETYRTLCLHGHRFEYAIVEQMSKDPDLWKSWDACMELLYDEIVRYANKHDFQLVCFGHTHTAFFEYRNGVYLCNPGSLCFSHDGRPPSYAIVTIDATITCEHIFLHETDNALYE